MIVGIDSGKKGGVAVLFDDRGPMFCRTPTLGPKGNEVVPAMIEALRSLSNAPEAGGRVESIFGELCGFPRQGITVVIEALARGAGKSTWTAASVSGRVWGEWVGIVQTLGLPLVVVRAQDWQKEMLRGEKTGSYAERKAASLKVAGRLYPTFAPLAGVKANDGIADALNIATYYQRLTVARSRDVE